MSLIIGLMAFLFVSLWFLVFKVEYFKQIKDSLKTVRVTVISESGDVVYDNYRDNLQNHADRPEVISALQTGFGESERYSDTLKTTTFYYAVKLTDGNILRLSLTIDSIYSWLYGFVLIVLGCLLVVLTISFVLAKRLTAKIIKPINNVDLENISTLPYDELSPFIKKIEYQKREINEQLEALENRADTIKTITENMKEGLILLDKHGIVLSANNSVSNMLGYFDIVGKNILHVNRNMELLEKIETCLGGTSSEMQINIDKKIFTVYLNPVYHNEYINGAIILFLDTTEKARAEKQRKEFTANVSHELKTPLTTITALSEMISNGMAKKDDVQGFAEKIVGQSKRLIELIDDIIRLSEFDEGSIEKSFELFDLYKLADAVIVSLNEKASQKSVALSLSGESFKVLANRRMIDELLYNLVDNGIKYNKDNGEVFVSISHEGEFAKITVSDTGIGISQKHIERIFERFYRVDKSRSKRIGGTGLGLSIVKQITSFHGGKIEIKSKVGVGTKICCYIKK